MGCDGIYTIGWDGMERERIGLDRIGLDEMEREGLDGRDWM